MGFITRRYLPRRGKRAFAAENRPAGGLKKSGGDEEDRTPDLRIANAALSQLSYVPTLRCYFSSKSSSLESA